MASFFIGTEKVELPATRISPTATSEQPNAWLDEIHITVQLSKQVEGYRVHTDGVAYPTGLPFGKRVPPRLASYAAGRWVFIGDQAISTSSEIISMFSLPGPFSHLSKAVIPAACVINVGLCKPLWGGDGGGVQVEYVRGPRFQFVQVNDNIWHHKTGNA